MYALWKILLPLHTNLSEYQFMKLRFILYILLCGVVFFIMAGCSEKENAKRKPQPSDTLYTEERAMAVYANDLEQALQIIDSARQVGHLTAQRADLLRATVYSRTLNTPCYDSAIVISERLLATEAAKTDPTFRQNLLELNSGGSSAIGNRDKRFSGKSCWQSVSMVANNFFFFFTAKCCAEEIFLLILRPNSSVTI